jgi:3-deoxy-7-phosphoheptulonate synthase
MTRYLNGAPEWRPGPLLWTSHEALILDYELPQLRRVEGGGLALTSTHWPWVGERTRQPDGAHVALLAAVRNPVASKVGPDATEDDLLELCARLDPGREPGRLTLIARMGAAIGETLSRLVAAVWHAGHPVTWLCDPMHANTVKAPCTRKTRFVDTILREIRGISTDRHRFRWGPGRPASGDHARPGHRMRHERGRAGPGRQQLHHLV